MRFFLEGIPFMNYDPTGNGGKLLLWYELSGASLLSLIFFMDFAQAQIQQGAFLVEAHQSQWASK